MLKNTFYPALVITAALLVFGLPLAPPALAVTFIVNSTEDLPTKPATPPGICQTSANTCTLRAAIMQANKAAEGATIILPSGTYKLTIQAAWPDGEENGDLNLTTPTIGSPLITIIGAGADRTVIDGNRLDRVFNIAAMREVSMSGVTIKNGFPSAQSSTEFGGGIRNSGVLKIENSKISGNQVTDFGGGIFNSGVLKLINCTISANITGKYGGGILNITGGNLTATTSTISGNIAGDAGGGIFNYPGGLATVAASTISGNQATHGGGIENENLLSLTNTTISQNIALGFGGGIYNIGQVNMYNSTITQNDADHDRDPNGGRGGGIYNSSTAIFNLRNSLVAGNSREDAPVPDECWGGTLHSFGRNLFGDLTDCTVITGSGSWNNLAGGLGPLQNNGGPTWTQALWPGSNAIDGGDPELGCIGPDGLPLATDQRGGARVAGVRCDIGAFEYGAIIPWLYLPMVVRN